MQHTSLQLLQRGVMLQSLLDLKNNHMKASGYVAVSGIEDKAGLRPVELRTDM